MSETFTLVEAPETPDFEVIPEGTILQVKITKAVVETTKMTDETTGEPVKQVVFTFAIQDEPYLTDKRLLWGRTSTTFSNHEKCRLYQWVKGIMSVSELPPGFTLNLQSLVGSACRVEVSVDTFDDKKQPVNEDGTYKRRSVNKVKNVIPARSTRAADPVRPDEEPF